MPLPEPVLPKREQEALDDIGRTHIASGLASSLGLGLLLPLIAVTVTQIATGGWRAATAALPSAAALAETARGKGMLAANRDLTHGLHTLEDVLEKHSPVLAFTLPAAQWLTTALLATGNTRAVVGQDGWLFYRQDIDHLTGRPFLSRPAAGRQRDANPLADLAAFAGLRQYGVSLLVVLAPAKAAIHPEKLVPGVVPPLANPSYPKTLTWLSAQGIAFLDPSSLLGQLATETGRPQYLATDTHWTFEAMDLVAQTTANAIRPLLPAPTALAYSRKSVVVTGQGDLVRMLRLPFQGRLYPHETVTTQWVSGPDGQPWQENPNAEILLLGDSFSLVYSHADLGWGSSAGLAEQLAFYLQRPIDRIAINAGGARHALSAELAAGRNRLSGKRVVLYQVAARHLGGFSAGR